MIRIECPPLDIERATETYLQNVRAPRFENTEPVHRPKKIKRRDATSLEEIILLREYADLKINKHPPAPKGPEKWKPGTRRVPHTPKGTGPRKMWGPT